MNVDGVFDNVLAQINMWSQSIQWLVLSTGYLLLRYTCTVSRWPYYCHFKCRVLGKKVLFSIVGRTTQWLKPSALTCAARHYARVFMQDCKMQIMFNMKLVRLCILWKAKMFDSVGIFWMMNFIDTVLSSGRLSFW